MTKVIENSLAWNYIDLKISTIMKSPALIVIVVGYLIASCATYQSISKRQEPQLNDIESKIQPNKKYLFHLNSGIKLKVDVTSTDELNVYGFVITEDGSGKSTKSPYQETKQRIAENTSKIEELSINPYWTGIAVLIPVAIIIYWAETFTFHLDNFSM